MGRNVYVTLCSLAVGSGVMRLAGFLVRLKNPIVTVSCLSQCFIFWGWFLFCWAFPVNPSHQNVLRECLQHSMQVLMVYWERQAPRFLTDSVL